MGGSEGQLKPWWQDWSTRFRSPVSPHVRKTPFAAFRSGSIPAYR